LAQCVCVDNIKTIFSTDLHVGQYLFDLYPDDLVAGLDIYELEMKRVCTNNEIDRVLAGANWNSDV